MKRWRKPAADEEEVIVERPEISHWKDWLPQSEPEPEPEDDGDGLETEDESEAKDQKSSSKKKLIAASMSALAILGCVGASAWYLIGKTSTDSEVASGPMATATVTATPTSSSAAPQPKYGFCEWPGQTAKDGDFSTPEGAIRRLQYAYYHGDPDGAAEAYADDSPVNVAELKKAIAQTPEKSEHCLYIKPVNKKAGLYNVDLFVQDEDKSVRTYLQKVTVREDDGKFKVFAVEARKEAS